MLHDLSCLAQGLLSQGKDKAQDTQVICLSMEIDLKWLCIVNNSERPVDALAEKHHLLTD